MPKRKGRKPSSATRVRRCRARKKDLGIPDTRDLALAVYSAVGLILHTYGKGKKISGRPDVFISYRDVLETAHHYLLGSGFESEASLKGLKAGLRKLRDKAQTHRDRMATGMLTLFEERQELGNRPAPRRRSRDEDVRAELWE